MSPRDVVLIGTSHHYQYGVGAKRHKAACTQTEEDAFREFAGAVAVASGVKAIAEELNVESLVAAGKQTSVLQRVADDLVLSHLFCEPNKRERAALGVSEETLLRSLAWMNDESEAEVQAQLDAQHQRRETVWLQRLSALSLWPLLFVCGADHVKSFTSRLAEDGVTVKVAHADWPG